MFSNGKLCTSVPSSIVVHDPTTASKLMKNSYIPFRWLKNSKQVGLTEWSIKVPDLSSWGSWFEPWSCQVVKSMGEICGPCKIVHDRWYKNRQKSMYIGCILHLPLHTFFQGVRPPGFFLPKDLPENNPQRSEINPYPPYF